MKKWIYFLLVTLSFVLYGNSISNEYALDDDNVINANYVQQGIAGIPSILTHRYGVQGNKAGLDYRPVVLVSFAIEYQFFKQEPHISHFINVLLYALCLIVLYNILMLVFRLDKINSWLPLVITILYAIHPIHTEVVDSLKNRDELFGLLFGLLFLKYGYLSFTELERRNKNTVTAILFLILTLTSKLVGILYFPILVLVLLFNKLLKWNTRNYSILGIFILLLIVFTGITIIGLKREFYSFENSLVGVKDPAVIFPTVFKTIFYHIKMLIVPYPLRFYYGYNLFPVESTFEPVVLLSFIFHTTIAIIGVIRFRKKDVLGLFILCYLVCMLLYANFPIPYVGMFSERALFLSSVWFIAASVIMIYRLINKIENKNLSVTLNIIFLFVFIVYSYQTIQRNFFWKNKMTLMSHDIPFLENSVAANYIYANVLYKQSLETTDSIYSQILAEKAASHYQQTINLYPFYPDFFYKLARLNSYKLNNTDRAEKLFKSILKIDPNYAGANFELAKIYFDRKDFRSSYPLFQSAYNANPTDSLVLFYLAQNALATGDLKRCYKVNIELLNLYPNNKYPYLNLGVYYSTILKDDSAVVYFEKGIALGDRNPDLLKNMVFYFNKRQNKEKATYYQKLLEQHQ